ncbi:hypothetical protein SAMN02745781_00602 [Vibrio gazogenes DSM 21264]|uniref:Uncharacterized protein n=1 Tax=Vibrio gazogenes DSM 21264 = NBRC 103151 TaxID=1123492 RepID=A0A1M4UZE7_VIBGA|nr:hypothetical protein SAMN02745781_00602 [Vibrio gazogenes DSM 21264] [Vibrio gazogenes DSM 21264 = NBRC 103151]SJN57846.1 hypothetical protein BQ6471_02752 [Vibrio gazogenes]
MGDYLTVALPREYSWYFYDRYLWAKNVSPTLPMARLLYHCIDQSVRGITPSLSNYGQFVQRRC